MAILSKTNILTTYYEKQKKLPESPQQTVQMEINRVAFRLRMFPVRAENNFPYLQI